MNSKFRNDETLEDYRHRVKSDRKQALKARKTELRKRDGIGCRWPGCVFWKHGYRVEAVHLVDMGMGGDKQLIRSDLSTMIRLCIRHHQEAKGSIHSKHIRVVPLTQAGTNGPCQFEEQDFKSPNGWKVVGVENDWDFRNRRNESATDDDDDETISEG